MFALADIDPKRGEKFSPNLYAWLKKQTGPRGFHRTMPAVFRGVAPKTEVDGHPFIGWMNACGCHPAELTGARLNSVLCFGAKQETGCWFGLRLEPWPDFWSQYLAIGRCALDPAHEEIFASADGRYVFEGDSRVCTWCGAKHRLERWEETIVKQRERWVVVPSRAQGAA